MPVLDGNLGEILSKHDLRLFRTALVYLVHALLLEPRLEQHDLLAAPELLIRLI